ncbi:MAG: hypothetical protein ACFFBD_10670 [Candidatus Hodarchaeota archaeon]
MPSNRKNGDVQKLSVPLDLALVAAARAIGSRLCPGDASSKYFVHNRFLYPIVYFFDFFGFPLRQLVTARSFLVYEKLWQTLQDSHPPEIVIHLSGGYSSHLLNLSMEDLQQHDKISREYILTDLSTTLSFHQTVNSRFFKDYKQKSPFILFLEYDVFRDNLVQLLEKHHVDFKNKKVLVFFEGFYYYLPPETRTELLKQIVEILKPQQGFLITDFQSKDFCVLLQERKLRGWRKMRNALATLIARKLTSSSSTYPLEKDGFEINFFFYGFQVVESTPTSDSKRIAPLSLISNLEIQAFPLLAFNVYLFQYHSPYPK